MEETFLDIDTGPKIATAITLAIGCAAVQPDQGPASATIEGATIATATVTDVVLEA